MCSEVRPTLATSGILVNYVTGSEMTEVIVYYLKAFNEY